MKKRLALLYCFLLSGVLAVAQTGGDSAARTRDTAPRTAPAKRDTPPQVPAGRDTPGQLPPAPDTHPARTIPPVTPARTQAAAQADSLVPRSDPAASDSALRAKAKDSAVTRTAKPALVRATRQFQAALRNHPYYNFFGRPIIMPMKLRIPEDQDSMFYFLAGLIFFFGVIKVLFSKYVDNIMTLFFRVTMRQQQLRDQMLQTPVASFLLNLLFMLSGGLFLAFVGQYYRAVPRGNTWVVAGACSLLLLVIYLGKFLVLKIMGWIFNVRAATDTYIFIVFLVNKMIGIFLLPVLVMMAFPYPPLYPVVVTLAFIMLTIFLGYRCVIAYKPIRSEIKVSRFHFFLYLCAFEIAPLLLIYKVLLIFVERSH